ncbi:three component ABC system middle component [Paraburkholderia adhaesiva]|uniref:three component ABC system middle component n=1 Tax=Paraburkholderia adhaesiva TaxID=2883244 RepID=UPI001F2F9DF2|nr:three component ABC system middle component [Paraburkholderia adhaesiva]
MTAARDVFAETNPAYCVSILTQFCKAYAQGRAVGRAPTVAIVYLALPIALSEDLAPTFDGCNKSTGLLAWLNRSPSVLEDLAKRTNATLDMTTAAIRFGCLTGMLRLTHEGELVSSLEKLPASVSGGVARASLKRAKLLGAWFATMGSPRAVLEALGVSV